MAWYDEDGVSVELLREEDLVSKWGKLPVVSGFDAILICLGIDPHSRYARDVALEYMLPEQGARRLRELGTLVDSLVASNELKKGESYSLAHFLRLFDEHGVELGELARRFVDNASTRSGPESQKGSRRGRGRPPKRKVQDSRLYMAFERDLEEAVNEYERRLSRGVQDKTVGEIDSWLKEKLGESAENSHEKEGGRRKLIANILFEMHIKQ